MTVRGGFKAGFGLNYSRRLNIGSAVARLLGGDEAAIGSGSGSGQANVAWWGSRAIDAAEADDLDLASLTDAFGRFLEFTAVKGLLIRAAASNAGNIIIGPAPIGGFLGPFADAGDTINLAAGQSFLVTNTGTGWTLPAIGGASVLRIANGSAELAAGYDIAVMGVGETAIDPVPDGLGLLLINGQRVRIGGDRVLFNLGA